MPDLPDWAARLCVLAAVLSLAVAALWRRRTRRAEASRAEAWATAQELRRERDQALRLLPAPPRQPPPRPPD